MKDTISKLLSINYTDYYSEPNYKEVAYTILNKLDKSELLEIVKVTDIYLANKRSVEELKFCIYDNLVGFRCRLQVLGEVASHSYRETKLG